MNGDLISRSALLDEFPLPDDITDPEKVFVHVTGIRAYIEAAPGVDAVPVVHGRWVLEEMTFDVGGDPMFPCSECKRLSYAHADGRMYNYCPNCGAKMDGGEEDAAD